MKAKYFYNKEPIKFIEEFELPKNGSLKCRSNYLNGLKNISFESNKNLFKISFKDILTSKNNKTILGKIIKDVSFNTEDETLKIQQIYLDSFNTGIINSIISSSLKKDKLKYYKIVIPLKKKINFNFQLSKFIYASENWKWSTNGTIINFEDEEIYILQEKDETKSKGYLIIESNKKQSFEEFADKMFAIRVSLGYILGNFIGGKAYYFAYNNKNRKHFIGFVFLTLRETIKTLMHPVNSNPYSWTRVKSEANKIYKRKELRGLTINEFSKLCQTVFKNDDFLAMLLLIIESSDASLIFRPSGYSIALETLSDIVIGDRKEKLSPITSKTENKNFRKDLNKVLDKYSGKECFKDIETLRGRINQVTNKERLKLPFKILNIYLSEEDLKVIASRNDFLHGRVPDYRELGDDRSINDKDKDLYYASVRLYTLLNMVILKHVGYDNYVLNFSKINEMSTGYPVEEGYYLKV